MKRFLLAALATVLTLAPALSDAAKAPGLKAQIAAIARAQKPGLVIDGRKISIGRSIAGSTMRQISGSGTVPGKNTGTGIGFGNVAPTHYTVGGFVTGQRVGFKISVQLTKNKVQPLAQIKTKQ